MMKGLCMLSRSVESDSLQLHEAAAHQTPLFMGFPRQKYWSGLPFPSPGSLPDLGIVPMSSALQADSLPSEPPGKPLVCLGDHEKASIAEIMSLRMS